MRHLNRILAFALLMMLGCSDEGFLEIRTEDGFREGDATIVAARTGNKMVPFRASSVLEDVADPTPFDPPICEGDWRLWRGTGSGRATVIREFTTNEYDCFRDEDGDGYLDLIFIEDYVAKAALINRGGVITAANGDQLNFSIPGTPLGTPLDLIFVFAPDDWEVFTVTMDASGEFEGGTGRFAGASGEFEYHQSYDSETDVTSVEWNGTISAPVGEEFVQGVCGQTIFESVTLTEDIGLCSGDGIIVGADGITLEGDGHWIRGSGSGTGVVVRRRSDVTVTHVFSQGFAEGVGVEGSTDVTVSESQIRENGTGVSLAVHVATGQATTGAVVTRNIFADNTLAVSASTSGNSIYHNILFNNTTQIQDVGGNAWVDPVENLGNYWSNYWGDDNSGDFIGDTDLPHEGVDNAPLLDPSIAQRFGGQMCDDWWTTTSWLVWRGGWSPVGIEVTDNLGRRLSATENQLGKDGFYAEYIDPETGSKLVQVLIGTCTKQQSADGVYSFEMTGLDDLDYSMEWFASVRGEPFFHQSLEDAPLANAETQTLNTNLEQTVDPGSGEVIGRVTFAQGVCGQAITESVTLTQDLSSCAGYGVIIGADGITLEGDGHIVSAGGTGTGVLFNRTQTATATHLFVSGFARGIVNDAGNGNTISESYFRDNGVGISLSSTGGTIVTRNTIRDNGVGVSAATSGNGIYHNILFNNETQIQDVGGNDWVDPVENLGNYWSNYWGEDNSSDFIGDTDLPHEGVDNAPLLDPSIPQGFGAQLCDDWWQRATWLVWRGGWSPVGIQVTDNLGRRLSATENQLGKDGFYAEDETVEPGTKLVQVLIGTCTKQQSADGDYSFEMTALADLTYSMEWFVSGGGQVLFRQSVEDVPLAAGETRIVETMLEQTTDPETGELVSATVHRMIDIDIKPGSSDNCLNNDGHGVIPVAILGRADFDVSAIDPATVELESLAVGARGRSNNLMANIEDANSDGFNDLVVQIEDVDGTFTSGSGTATLTGALFDGTLIQGSDAICVVP